MFEWQPIATAPYDAPILIAGRRPFSGTFVAAATMRNSPQGRWFAGCEFGGWEWDWEFLSEDVTHWARLPAAPDYD